MGEGRAAVLEEGERAFLEGRRVAHLATVDAKGMPNVGPVCFALAGDTVYMTIDRKPKSGRPLKRLRNIAENPHVTLTADHYDDDDWSRLRWVMVRGRAEILADGAEHDDAQARLRAKYPQYRAMDLAPLPVIAIRIERATSWSAAGGGSAPR
ncbi:MAG: TIGR03668 family PPOX class F420-dependent oxidoreductase [Rhodospirillales bacterium]|nr:TIGR03668 family PPOX class F420-dependent oxidoreductase [Rhodospirillales bacterium]MDE0380318.1 TIGR03668 family PPOX class F420-dependent oxidoreductase [Rhodospirillales bacterium]